MRYDAEEFIARSRSPPEAPQPTREKIGITRKRLMLAVIRRPVARPGDVEDDPNLDLAAPCSDRRAA
jgi:hypothetical protein